MTLLFVSVACMLGALVQKPEGKPLPTGPDVSATVERHRRSVFLIRTGTTSGTAFLIAENPPLLATAAHVVAGARPADIVLTLNESAQSVRASASHLHPAYQPARNWDDPFTPDVALIECISLPRDHGPPFPLLSPRAASGLPGKWVASLGYPFFAIALANGPSTARATVGAVSQLLDDARGTGGEPARRWIIEHGIRALPGQSGSPLFLPSGEVVGIMQAFREFTATRQDAEIRERVSYAVRVDAVWELLEDLKLTDAVRGSPEGLSRLHAASSARPAAGGAAAGHLEKARSLLTQGDYRDACEAANAAIAAAPRSDEAFGSRAKILHEYGIHFLDAAKRPKEAARYFRLALEDYDRAREAATTDGARTQWKLARGTTDCALGGVEKDRATHARALAFAREVLAGDQSRELKHLAWEVAG